MKIQRILDGLEPLDSDFRYLEQRKSEGPARRIKATRAKRTTTIFSSKKMGQTVPTESILEFYVALNLELSSSVVGFWEQPPTVKVSKTRKNGIAYTGEHTPDFLALLANDALVAIEVKYAEEILKKLGKIECPFMETDDRFSYPAAKERYSQQSIHHLIVTNRDLGPALFENGSRLSGYRGEPPSDEAFADEILNAIQTSGITTIGKMLEGRKSLKTRGAIHWLLANGKVFGDVCEVSLRDVGKFNLYANATLAAANEFLGNTAFEPPSRLDLSQGSVLVWRNIRYTVQGVSQNLVLLIDQNDKPIQLDKDEVERMFIRGHIRNDESSKTPKKTPYEQASEERKRIVHKRLEAIREYENGNKVIKKRTYHNYKKAMREAATLHGCPWSGLLEKVRTGNQSKRLSPIANRFITGYIVQSYLGISIESCKKKGLFLEDLPLENEWEFKPSVSRRDSNKFAAWTEYKLLSKSLGIDFFAYDAFINRCKLIPDEIEAQQKRGPKAAVQKELPFSGDTSGAETGAYAGHLVEFDHTKIDTEATDGEGFEATGRLWLSILKDTYSRMILGWCFLLQPPSRVSLMMALRSMVQRHGFFPANISVDGGSEFRSTYFRQLIASYSSNTRDRPIETARYGRFVERSFNSFNLEFWHKLEGSTLLMLNPRAVSKEFQAKERAIWRYGDLEREFENYVDLYNNEMKCSTTGSTPANRYKLSFEDLPLKERRLVSYDERFLHATMLPVSRGGERKIKNGGVRLLDLYYTSDHLRTPAMDRKVIKVRYDPFDLGYVQYEYNGTLHRAEPSGSPFRGLTPSEVKEKSILLVAKRSAKPEFKEERSEVNVKNMMGMIQTEEKLSKEKEASIADKKRNLRTKKNPPKMKSTEYDIEVGSAPIRTKLF